MDRSNGAELFIGVEFECASYDEQRAPDVVEETWVELLTLLHDCAQRFEAVGQEEHAKALRIDASHLQRRAKRHVSKMKKELSTP